MGQTFRNFPDRFGVDDIMPGAAGCGGVPGVVVEGWLTLPLDDPLGDSARKLPGPCYDVPTEPCESDDPDLAAMLGAAPPGDAWAVVVSAAEEYWTWTETGQSRPVPRASSAPRR